MIGRMMVSALALTGVAYAQDVRAEEAVATPDCAPTPTCAVTPPRSSSDRVTYDAAFFAQYNPQTALDMVRQTPGFSLDGGDDRRGFSGAVGNLLIDGVRPSSKSQSLDGILSRIPANQVVRVELLRGAEVAGDASGQAVLLNVVRTASAGSGVYSIGAEYTSREVLAPQGELSYSGRNGSVEWGLGGSIFSQYRDLPGWRQFYDANGVYTGRADTPSPRDYREAALNGNIALPLLGGRLSATGQADWFRFHSDSGYNFFDAANAPTANLFNQFEERKPNFELGLTYDRDIGPWALQLIALANRGYYESREVGSFEDGAGVLQSTYAQDIEQDTGETIGRFSLARNLGSAQRIEFGGEAAYNSLDQRLAFVEDNGGGPVPAAIPNANVLIEEDRAEFFATHTWRPADRWSLETRLAWETSTLTFTGDDNQSVDLAFWKPSVQVTRTIGENNQLRLRIYRDVGQLDFGDFVSAAAVADNLISGGNTDLRPQTDWRAELGADMRFGPAALSLTFTHHEYKDVADLVTLTDDRGTPNPADDIIFDAPGNLGEGSANSLDVNFSTPISFIPGSRLSITGYLWDTEVVDPLTGQTRAFSNRPESQIEINFRQDLTEHRLAWGFSAYKEGEVQAYRFNEIDTSEEGPWIDGFIETTALPGGAKLRFTAANMFNGDVHRDRLFYGPDRNGAFLRRDLRERTFRAAPWFILELSGTF